MPEIRKERKVAPDHACNAYCNDRWHYDTWSFAPRDAWDDASRRALIWDYFPQIGRCGPELVGPAEAPARPADFRQPPLSDCTHWLVRWVA